FFFFSSRRRHTRSYGDWSSDVCSSDLPGARAATPASRVRRSVRAQEMEELDAFTQPAACHVPAAGHLADDLPDLGGTEVEAAVRSEERRVGKEGRSRRWTEQ